MSRLAGLFLSREGQQYEPDTERGRHINAAPPLRLNGYSGLLETHTSGGR